MFASLKRNTRNFRSANAAQNPSSILNAAGDGFDLDAVAREIGPTPARQALLRRAASFRSTGR